MIKKPIPRLSETTLARFLVRARRAAGLSGNVNLLVTSSREMRRLNLRFRGKDEPTDVLSFPVEGSKESFAGELAIAAEIASRSARELGHSFAQEVKILTLHGILHLAGYDHETDSGEMSRQECSLRKVLELPDGLIERNEKIGAASSSLRKSAQRKFRTQRRKECAPTSRGGRS